MRFILSILLFTFSITSNAQFGKLLDKAKAEITGTKDDQTGLGLKEALNNGISSAVDQLSSPKGYLESQYKILIPEDSQKVINVVKRVPGFHDVEDN